MQDAKYPVISLWKNVHCSRVRRLQNHSLLYNFFVEGYHTTQRDSFCAIIQDNTSQPVSVSLLLALSVLCEYPAVLVYPGTWKTTGHFLLVWKSLIQYFNTAYRFHIFADPHTAASTNVRLAFYQQLFESFLFSS